VVPLALRYLDAEGQWTRAAAYANEVTMAQCMVNILSEPSLTVELNFEAPLEVSGRSRQELARAAETLIAQRLNVPMVHSQPETADGPPT
jgi:1-acyl-sn-glycerol-3-phosphate acyltransferase